MDGIAEHVEQAQHRIVDIERRLRQFTPPQPAPDGRSSVFQQMVARHADLVPPAQLEGYIEGASAEYHLRPSLLRALIRMESGFNANAVSPKGAQGLTQLMPGTAAALGVADPFDPAQNIMGGARYLRQQLDRFNGDERLALAAYNAGPGAVLRYNGVPPFPETQRYVNSILDQAAE